MVEPLGDASICVIVRTQPGREMFLDNALFSLASQEARPTEVRVVVHLQGDETSEGIRANVDLWKSSLPGVHVIEHHFEGDGRTRSLNVGVAGVQTRFVGFLDDDDVYYPRHLRILRDALNGGVNAWAYSDSVLAKYVHTGEGNERLVTRSRPFTMEEYSFLVHLKGNFIPFHTFLVDTTRTDSAIWFNEEFTRCEDYEFLLRLANSREPVHVREETCEYRIRLDGTNSSMLDSSGVTQEEYFEKHWDWVRSDHQLEKAKFEIVGWWVHEILDLPDVAANSVEARAAQRQIDELWASRSWRATLPIRFFVSLVRFHRPPRKPHVSSFAQAEEATRQIKSSSSWGLAQRIRRLTSLGG